MENVWYAVNSSVEESLIFLCIELFFHERYDLECDSDPVIGCLA